MNQKDYQRALELSEYAWKTGDLRHKLHVNQLQIWDTLLKADDAETLIFSSRQWGKSYVAYAFAVGFCLAYPDSIVRIFTPTLRNGQNIVNDNILPITRDAPSGVIRRIKSDYTWLVGSSQIRLAAMDTIRDADNSRGGNSKLILIDEGGQVDSDKYAYLIESVISAQLLHSDGRLIHLTTPSRRYPSHYIHTTTLPKCQAKGTLHKFTIYDNPRLNDKQINKIIDMCGGTHTAAFRSEYMCEIVRDEEFVCVPEFNESIHVSDFQEDSIEHFKHANFCIAVDFGGSRDKTAAVLMAYCLQDNRVYVLDERVFPANTNTETIVEGLRSLQGNYNVTQFIADAPGQIITDLRNKHNFPMEPPRKDDWQAGLNALRLSIHKDRLHVHKRCLFTIHSLFSATFNTNKTDFDRTEDLGHMDAIAALIYGNRMIDRTTNRIPHVVYNKETHLHREGVTASNFTSSPEKYTGLFIKKNFMRK